MYADGDGEVVLASSRRRARQLPRQPVLRLRLRARRAGRPGGDGLSYSVGRALDDLDPAACGREAAERACRLLGARKCPSMKAPVVLDPFVAAAFFGVLSSALTADAVQKGRSLFAGREGQQVAGELLELVDDGMHPRRPGQRPVRRRGHALPAHAADRAAACCRASCTTPTRPARPGAPPPATACAARTRACPACAPPTSSSSGPATPLADIIAGIERGVLVTDAVGVHSGANPISGEFSVGISGILIEGGELTTPVREVTLAGDIITMLTSVARWATTPAGCPAAASSRPRWSSTAWPSAAPEPVRSAGPPRDQRRGSAGERSRPAPARGQLPGGRLPPAFRPAQQVLPRQVPVLDAARPAARHRRRAGAEAARRTARSTCSPAPSSAPWRSWRPSRSPAASRS